MLTGPGAEAGQEAEVGAGVEAGPTPLVSPGPEAEAGLTTPPPTTTTTLTTTTTPDITTISTGEGIQAEAKVGITAIQEAEAETVATVEEDHNLWTINIPLRVNLSVTSVVSQDILPSIAELGKPTLSTLRKITLHISTMPVQALQYKLALLF